MVEVHARDKMGLYRERVEAILAVGKCIKENEVGA